MAAAAIPLFLMAAGKGMQIMGSLQSDSDQADAERANASFFREQAEFTREATVRELQLFNTKAVESFGQTVGAYAASGVQLSASALEVLAGEKKTMNEQANAIKREGEFKQRLALLRANQADATADSLTSSGRQFNTIVGGALEMGSSFFK